MGTIRDLAEKFWSGGLEPGRFWRPTWASEEVAPGVHFLHALANITLIQTGSGLILVDTGSHLIRDQAFEAVRALDISPLLAAIYTHGHVDHAFGLRPFLAEAEAKGWKRPLIVGHRAIAARFDRYRAMSAHNSLINGRQFGVPVQWPTEFDYPDTTYDAFLRLDVGGVPLELHHALGETDDHSWVWWPERRIVWTGDLFLWVTPNAGNPQKVQRYAAEWAAASAR